MKKLLLYVLTIVPALVSGQGTTFSIGSPKTPDFSKSITLNPKDDGYFYTNQKGVGEKPLLIDIAANKVVPYQSMASVRANALAVGKAPAAISITDNLRSGTFVLKPGDTTTPDDGALYIRTQSNLLYARDVPDRRITPQMFGAIPNDGQDDAAALVAWVNAAGWAHYLPDGVYDCSAYLFRFNKGRFNLTGAGIINFSGDTSGLGVVNALDSGQYGTIVIEGISLNSSGNKSAGRDALLVTSQHEGPAPIIRGVKVTSLVANQEWTYGFHSHDCSNITFESCDVQSASRSVCTAYGVTNTANRPAVNPTFRGCNSRNIYRGFSVIGLGNPGIEGVTIDGGEIVNPLQGIYGTAEYNAPIFKVLGPHINSFGGECLYLSNFNQVFINAGSWYANPDPATGVTPTRAVYLNNVTMLDGRVAVNLIGNIANAVYLDGSGGLVDFNISAGVTQGESNVVYVSAGYAGSEFGNKRQWAVGGAGSNTGKNIVGPGKDQSRIKLFAHPDAQFPNDGDILQYKASDGLYKPTSGNRFVQGQFPNSRSTNLTDVTSDVPSGYYALASSTNVPVDASGFNNWLWNKTRYENGNNSGDRWSGDYLINLKTKKPYFGGWDAQTGAMAPWKLALTTPDTPVSGDLFYYDGNDFKRIPKGSNGQFLKMVSGLPAWSN